MNAIKTLFILAAALALQWSVQAADTYTIDPAHTRVGFSVRHLGISNVKGKFNEFTGSLVLDNDALKAATATIQVASVGINYHQLLETGVAAVGEEVELDINAEAIKDANGKNAPAK